MEVRLDVSGADMPGLLAAETFLAMRVGQVHQQASLRTSRTFIFPQHPEGSKAKARLEIFARTGFADVRLGEVGDSGAEVAVSCDIGCSTDAAPEHQKMCLRLFARNVGQAAPSGEQDGGKKQYVVDHRLDDFLADALTDVISEKPRDPQAYISKRMMSKSASDSKLRPSRPGTRSGARPQTSQELSSSMSAQKLPPIRKEVLSEPAPQGPIEVRVDASSAHMSGLLTADTFVGMLIGDVRQQARLGASRSFKFPQPPEGRGAYARLEIFKRLGFADVRFDEVSGAQVEVSCNVGASADAAPEEKKLCIAVSAQNAGKAALIDKKSRTQKRFDEAQQYFDNHQLDDVLADAMRDIIRDRPSDPQAYLCKRLQKLPPIDKEELSEPAAKVVAPAPPPPPAEVEPIAEEKPLEEKSEPPPAPAPPFHSFAEYHASHFRSMMSTPTSQVLYASFKKELPPPEPVKELPPPEPVQELPPPEPVQELPPPEPVQELPPPEPVQELPPPEPVQELPPPEPVKASPRPFNSFAEYHSSHFRSIMHAPTLQTLYASFKSPPPEPAKPKKALLSLAKLRKKDVPWHELVTPEVNAQSQKLGNLSSLSKEERLANLGAMDNMSVGEKALLLEKPGRAQELLSGGGADELTVLIGHKSSKEIGQCHALWSKLEAGEQISFEDLNGVDLKYTDSSGNTALHYMKTSEQAQVLLQVETGRQLADCRNHKGENAVASVMQKVSGTSQGASMLKLFSEVACSALCVARQEGGLPPPTGAEKEVLAPAVSWPEVREMLVSDGLEDFLERMNGLSDRVRAARPGIEADDHAGIWTEILFEHCFGDLERVSSPMGETMEHTELSKERLRDVFRAMELLVRACSDTTRTDKDAKELEKITKGLLAATRGPGCPPFDPREPYRAKFLDLIRELQTRTAVMLSDVYETALKEESEAAFEVGQFPRDELHGVDTSGAAVREAKGRLRMDSPIVNGNEVEGKPLETPEWVFGQYLNLEAWDGLQRSGVIETPADIVKVSSQGGTVEVEGLTEARVRFCRLHAAWMRGYCNERQKPMAQKLQDALELQGDTASGPCPAVGGTKVRFFRTRSEAKGVSRILEKMDEAIEEELSCERARSILEADCQGKQEEELASRELLTPACYVCDLNGAEVVVDTFAELDTIYKSLRSKTILNDGIQVVRTKNGFSSDIPSDKIASQGGYRDLKLWVSVMIEETPLVAEMQLHIRGFYDMKRIMHLPYECSRGSFDHPHLATLWKQPLQPQEPEPKVPSVRSKAKAMLVESGRTGKLQGALSKIRKPKELPKELPRELPKMPELGPWFTRPSVASWLQKKPREVERPASATPPSTPAWFVDPASFGEHAAYVAMLQTLLAERDKQLEVLQKRLDSTEANVLALQASLK